MGRSPVGHPCQIFARQNSNFSSSKSRYHFEHKTNVIKLIMEWNLAEKVHRKTKKVRLPDKTPVQFSVFQRTPKT